MRVRVRSRLVLWTTYLISAAFVGACVEQFDGNEDAGGQAVETADASRNTNPLIFDPETWDYITDHEEDHGDHRVVLGQSVAALHLPNFTYSCSGVLVNDGVIATAKHCDFDEVPTVVARFGQFGSRANAGIFEGDSDSGVEVARRRLQERLGFSQAAAISAVPNQEALSWNCTFIASLYNSSHGYRDIHFLECTPRAWSTGQKTVSVLPGHIFGAHHPKNLDSHSNPLPVDTGLWDLSHNHKSTSGIVSDLISPYGYMSYSHDSIYNGGEYYGHVFRSHNDDNEVGSSGGAVLRLSNNDTFGVISFDPFPGSNYMLFTPSASVYNISSYHDSYAEQTFVTNAPEVTTSYQPINWSGGGAWVGGTGGTGHTLTCPSNHIAVGVIGSTGYGGWVGNLGLVCAAWQPFRSHQLDHAYVYSAGSWDTGFISAAGERLYDYYRNVVSSTEPDGLQTMALCPEGEYMSGINVYSGTYVARIYSIQCKRYNFDWSSNSVLPVEPIGTNSSGTWHSSTCPSGSYVKSLALYSGWVVDSLAVWCMD